MTLKQKKDRVSQLKREMSLLAKSQVSPPNSLGYVEEYIFKLVEYSRLKSEIAKVTQIKTKNG